MEGAGGGEDAPAGYRLGKVFGYPRPCRPGEAPDYVQASCIRFFAGGRNRSSPGFVPSNLAQNRETIQEPAKGRGGMESERHGVGKVGQLDGKA